MTGWITLNHTTPTTTAYVWGRNSLSDHQREHVACAESPPIACFQLNLSKRLCREEGPLAPEWSVWCPDFLVFIPSTPPLSREKCDNELQLHRIRTSWTLSGLASQPISELWAKKEQRERDTVFQGTPALLGASTAPDQPSWSHCWDSSLNKGNGTSETASVLLEPQGFRPFAPVSLEP